MDERVGTQFKCKKKMVLAKKDLEIGDIVLLVSPDNSRAHWALGCVIETYIGRDKHVCSVKVQVGDKQFVRPVVVKLCSLELGCSA